MKKTKKPEGPVVSDVYETEIEYNCPVRGKVKQKVKVKRYEAVEPPSAVEEVLPTTSLAEKLDRQFSGLVITDDSLEDESAQEEV